MDLDNKASSPDVGGDGGFFAELEVRSRKTALFLELLHVALHMRTSHCSFSLHNHIARSAALLADDQSSQYILTRSSADEAIGPIITSLPRQVLAQPPPATPLSTT